MHLSKAPKKTFKDCEHRRHYVPDVKCTPRGVSAAYMSNCKLLYAVDMRASIEPDKAGFHALMQPSTLEIFSAHELEKQSYNISLKLIFQSN